MARTVHAAAPATPHVSMLRRYWPLAALCAILTLLVGVSSLIGSEQLQVTLTEMLIRLIVVVGIYTFIGNAGILSFGHIGFMCIGAYAAAWATVDPTWKQMMLTGLPDFLQQNQYGFLPAVAGGALLAGLVALIVGAAIMRLSGIAGSIATFALLAIVNSVYSNWESVTAATSSIIGVPAVVGPWVAWMFAIGALVLAYVFQVSRFGLMLRASRDDEVAAKSSGVNVVRMRLIAFVVSAMMVGVAGALYAHFLGILTADTFYLSMTFVTLAMLVVGGVGSLFGLLLQIFLLVMLGRWLFRRFFAAPAMVGGGLFARAAMPGGPPPRGVPLTGIPAGRAIQIGPGDYQAFEQLLQGVQQAWSNHDLNALRAMATPEMVSYFAEQLGEQTSRGVHNFVTAVRLEKGDLAEAWAENGREYATVAMQFSMTDVTRDRAGQVVDGSLAERITATEIWTFLRVAGGRWILSAIQQAR